MRHGTWRQWGPSSGTGLITAGAVAAADQASKLWLVDAYHLAARGVVPLTPFLDLVLTWNKGISYGLFQQEGALGPWLLTAFKILAVGLLWLWLANATTRLTSIGLGLIIGGAVGNIVDWFHFGAVADFIHFHITTATFRFSWYVFNLADVAIVVGVAALLYDSLRPESAVKAP